MAESKAGGIRLITAPRLLYVHNKRTVFVQTDGDALRENFPVEEFEVRGDTASPWRAWRAVRRNDMVVTQFASAHAVLPTLCAWLQGKPVVTILAGYDVANVPEIRYGHQQGGIRRWVARLVIALSTRLVCNSQFLQREAEQNAHAPHDKITVVYLGVATPNTLLPAKDAKLVLSVGNVDRANLWRKGLEPFVRAAAELPDSNFVLVGAWLDDAVQYLQSIATPNVTITGQLPASDLQEYFRRAAVYVQPSRHEGFGVAVAEAMAMGSTPVVTRVGALPEVVGDAGIYAESADPHDLAAAIREAQRSHAVLGPAARERIRVMFPHSQRIEGLREVIDSVAAGVNSDAVAAPPPNLPTPLPFVSVIIPARNEEQSIAACVQAVLDQDYPADHLEVLVIDGQSTDQTVRQVQQLAQDAPHQRLRVLDNPGRIAPTALNVGILNARGEIIARVDGHTTIARDYIRRAVATMHATGADNVGGLMRPHGTTYAGACIALATSSPFGVGNARFHYDARGGEADTVYMGCFKRAIFERVGMFDETLVRNQDDELNDRIIAAGGLIWLDPAIRSHYENRATWRALWRQYYQYGYWKVRVLRRHPHAIRARHLAPSALVIGLTLTAVLHLLPGRGGRLSRLALSLLALATWGMYGLASTLFAVRMAASSGRWSRLPGLLLTFWCLHLSYGCGVLAGVGDRTSVPESHIPHLDRRDQKSAVR